MAKKKTVKYVSISILVTILLGISATIAKWMQNNIWDYKYIYNPKCPSDSIREAKNNGIFVNKVSILPVEVSINRLVLQFGEAWLEREVEHEYFLIWLKRHKDTGNYHFCFRLQNGHELFFGKSDLQFVVNNNAITCFTPYISTTVAGKKDILFFSTINTNVLFNEVIILCVRGSTSSLAKFHVTSFGQCVPKNVWEK